MHISFFPNARSLFALSQWLTARGNRGIPVPGDVCAPREGCFYSSLRDWAGVGNIGLVEFSTCDGLSDAAKNGNENKEEPERRLARARSDYFKRAMETFDKSASTRPSPTSQHGLGLASIVVLLD